MLHVILFILKLLGILILILLGLIILAALLVLFVPVRYRGEGSYFDKVKGNIKISWLLHILSVTVRYEEDVVIAVRLFGFSVMRPKKVDEELKEAEEIMVQAMEVKEPEAVKEAKQLGRDVKKTVQGESLSRQPVLKDSKQTEQTEQTEHISWFQGLFHKIKNRIIHFLEKIKYLYRKFCDTLKNMKEKKDEIQAFLSNSENQKTAKLLYRQVKRLIRHVFPVKGHGKVTFGFEDPGLTGQALMAASLLYPFFHKYWNLYPVFDESVFTAEGTFQGRIRLGTVLIIGVRMLLDKNFRVLLKRWLR
jgi:cell shape-determining protein MreC